MALDGSYLDRLDANDYFNGRLNSEAWEDAANTDRNKALITATKMIEQLNFIGIKNSEDQEFQFPRGGDSTTPQEILDAVCELAYELLDGKDPDLEFENLAMTSQGYGNVRSTYDRSIVQEHILAGIPSVRAWRLLKPYLRDSKAIIISRVS